MCDDKLVNAQVSVNRAIWAMNNRRGNSTAITSYEQENAEYAICELKGFLREYSEEKYRSEIKRLRKKWAKKNNGVSKVLETGR